MVCIVCCHLCESDDSNVYTETISERMYRKLIDAAVVSGEGR